MYPNFVDLIDQYNWISPQVVDLYTELAGAVEQLSVDVAIIVGPGNMIMEQEDIVRDVLVFI